MLNKKTHTNEWFFSKPNAIYQALHIYVNGDKLVITPILLAILLIGVFSWKFMLLMFGVYLTFRGLGEMIYWLLQQFSLEIKYRPEDGGKQDLDDNAIYILYQLTGLRTTILGSGIVLFVILYLY